MNQRATREMRFAFSFVVASTVLACSSSASRPSDAGAGADAGAQAIREDADEIPCEPRRVLQTVCQQCHSLPPQNGAPFSLVRRADIVATRSGVVVRELMIQQLDAWRMPLTPVTMSSVDREVLLEWLRAGAPATTPRDCTDTADDGGADTETGQPPRDSGNPPPDAGADSPPEVDAADQ